MDIWQKRGIFFADLMALDPIVALFEQAVDVWAHRKMSFWLLRSPPPTFLDKVVCIEKI